MGFLVIRTDEVKRVYLDEIAILVIENPAVSLTGCLIVVFHGESAELFVK